MNLQELINKSTYIEKSNDNNCCSICFETLKNKSCRKLICNHQFHINCIDKWLSKNNSCPICRHVLENEKIFIESSNRQDNYFDFNPILKYLLLSYLIKKSEIKPNMPLSLTLGFMMGFYSGYSCQIIEHIHFYPFLIFTI